MTSFPSELKTYVGRMREFDARDWLVYVLWVATISGLAVATGGFLLIGHRAGVSFPVEAQLVPIGAAIFAVAVAVDTIGHRTIYREVIAGGEALVHHITIACGVGSVILLVLAASSSAAVVPAAVLTILSFVYSLVDEGFHWRRYVQHGSDRVEMWSHVLILTGHGVMMGAWWAWWHGGYLGVDQTLIAMGFS